MPKQKAAMFEDKLTRDRPLGSLRNTALLVVDVQYYVAAPGYGEHKELDPQNIPQELKYYFDRINTHVVPNISRLLAALRPTPAEIAYTYVESMTKDGRDSSLDYKISGIMVPKGSRDANILDPIAPLDDEFLFPKTTSSVFNSTNIDYVLRNLEIDYLVVAGVLTDQCVESSVRDACDKGYLVTVVEDACATYTPERHHKSLEMYNGYCRIVKTDAVLEEIKKLNS